MNFCELPSKQNQKKILVYAKFSGHQYIMIIKKARAKRGLFRTYCDLQLSNNHLEDFGLCSVLNLNEIHSLWSFGK